MTKRESVWQKHCEEIIKNMLYFCGFTGGSLACGTVKLKTTLRSVNIWEPVKNTILWPSLHVGSCTKYTCSLVPTAVPAAGRHTARCSALRRYRCIERLNLRYTQRSYILGHGFCTGVEGSRAGVCASGLVTSLYKRTAGPRAAPRPLSGRLSPPPVATCAARPRRVPGVPRLSRQRGGAGLTRPAANQCSASAGGRRYWLFRAAG